MSGSRLLRKVIAARPIGLLSILAVALVSFSRSYRRLRNECRLVISRAAQLLSYRDMHGHIIIARTSVKFNPLMGIGTYSATANNNFL